MTTLRLNREEMRDFSVAERRVLFHVPTTSLFEIAKPERAGAAADLPVVLARQPANSSGRLEGGGGQGGGELCPGAALSRHSCAACRPHRAGTGARSAMAGCACAIGRLRHLSVSCPAARTQAGGAPMPDYRIRRPMAAGDSAGGDRRRRRRRCRLLQLPDRVVRNHAADRRAVHHRHAVRPAGILRRLEACPPRPGDCGGVGGHGRRHGIADRGVPGARGRRGADRQSRPLCRPPCFAGRSAGAVHRHDLARRHPHLGALGCNSARGR